MDASRLASILAVGILMHARCLHAGFYPGPGPRTVRDLCPSGYYNALALCPEELECTYNSNCSSENVCCRNSCGTSTCVAPWIREVSSAYYFFHVQQAAQTTNTPSRTYRLSKIYVLQVYNSATMR